MSFQYIRTGKKEFLDLVTVLTLHIDPQNLEIPIIGSKIKVVESGGWKKFLKFSRSPRNATQRRLARQNYAQSPHGQISVLAHQRWNEGHSIISTHGGLILLAVPFQVLLATLPLAMVLMVPDSVMRENRRLELALILYVFTLSVVMKYYPRIANKYIGIASFTRKWLISMTKISWLAPVLILWLMGRMASVVVLGWIGLDWVGLSWTGAGWV